MSEQSRMTMVNNVGRTVLRFPIQCKRCGEYDFSPCDGYFDSIPDRIKALEDEIEILRSMYGQPEPLDCVESGNTHNENS